MDVNGVLADNPDLPKGISSVVFCFCSVGHSVLDSRLVCTTGKQISLFVIFSLQVHLA